MATKKVVQLFLAALLVSLTLASSGQSITTEPISDDSYMVSDGISSVRQPNLISLNRFSQSNNCHESYGFLPCTTTALGNIFLIVVYGYFMFLSAKLLSIGSEFLLQILGPGIIGGFLLPILGAFPDAMIILASGLSSDKETAQRQVSVGMGLLAGSNIMLLTVLWGSCLIFGKCDLENSKAVDHKDTKGFSLTGSGVSTDIWTSYAGFTVVVSIIPFIIVQLPLVFKATSFSRLSVLISFIISVSLFIGYSLYQIFQPWIQKRKLAYAKHKHVMSGLLKSLRMNSFGKLFTEDGEPNKEVLKKLFRTVDQNSDGSLSVDELRALIIGFQLEEEDMNVDDAVAQVMKDFDTSHDKQIDEIEFVKGFTRWLNKIKRAAIMHQGRALQSLRLLNDFDMETRREADLYEDRSDEVVENVDNPNCQITKAVLMLILGAVVAAASADPLVDAVENFSTATSIAPFFVSFVILPFVSSSEIVSTMIAVSQKRIRTTSLAYSEIYGSVIMSNILTVAVFMGLVYIRSLAWDFASEVLVILIVCSVMGFTAGCRTTFPLWMSVMAILLYPFSLLLVYILNYVSGWS
ncbi:sodium/calcium exchanger NCL1-like [Humulus lupulus]|uniref:sodium/calcium exchanger NCL1-like n=1 Tax=Humulus lupulus TaxID=3486 RepID=UPI002B4068ED|nr:sodium/calcium exchanger NCL1-like [Humulus lupulus]